MAASSPHDPELIVAYLDGELNDATAAEFESQLTADPELRRRVEHMTRAWDMLDMLPVAKGPADFTTRTLTAVRIQTQVGTETAEAPTSTVAKDVSAELSRTTTLNWQVWGIRLAGLVGLMLAAVVGFQSSFQRTSAATRQLLQELPVIQRFNEYQEVRSVEFLQELHRSGLFDDTSPGDRRER